MGSAFHRRLTAAGGDFYDVPWTPGSPILDDELLPVTRTGGWQRAEHGPWLHLAPPPPGEPVADQGWKVHVSALPDEAAAVAGECFEACRELTVTLKVLRSRGLVMATQQKYADPASSGKVVTCYPPPDRLERLCEGLAGRLRGRRAPRVVGELQVPGAPVYLRHGAFRARWMPTSDGRTAPAVDRGDGPRPDVRGAGAGRAGPADEPDYVTRLRAATARSEQRLDYRDIRLVHRSNAGGVYRAVAPDGRAVLLKEARHHAGLDLAGTDARTRLRHEAAALHRLAGSGVAPEPVDYLTVSDSDFLVMQYVDGAALTAGMAQRHPVVCTDLPAGSGPGYLRWVDRVVGEARAALARMHERGVVHRDVQPANLIDTGDRVVVVDFESCAIDGVSVSRGVATPGFSDDRSGAADPCDDLASLRRVRAMLVNPLTPLLHRRTDLERELHEVGLADLGAAAPPSDVVPAPDVGRLADGIAATATPHRTDRLFPGDAAQFVTPRGGLGLLHGAAGTLLVLTRLGLPCDPEWVDWLAARAVADGPFPRGFGGGADGVAWALAELGAEASAERVVDTFLDGPVAPAPWWQHGGAGRSLALAGLGRRLGRDDLVRRARAEAGAVVAAVRAPDVPPGYRPGLCSGWSGIGLALLALADLVEDAPEHAHAALTRELPATAIRGDCLLALDGHTLLPYLGVGGAACGLLAERLVTAPEVVAGVRATCARRVVSFAGVLTGRSGLLAVLDALSDGTDPMIAEHRRRLAWHTTDVTTTGGATALGVLGDHNLRCSTDLATGTAGMLVALSPRPGAALTALLGLTAPAERR